MPLVREQIDARLVSLLDAEEGRLIVAPDKAKEPDPARERAYAVMEKQGARRGDSTRGEKGTYAGCSLFFAVAGLAAMLGGSAPTGAWVTMYVVAVLGLLAFLGATVQRPRKDTRTFSTDLLDALLPLVAAELSPVERRYGDVLEALARESPGLDAAARAELLAQANGLLADSRALAEKRRGLAGDLADVDDAALAVLNADRDRLLAEAGASDDPVVASSKRQAAQMIDGRIEDARVVARMTARMRAQEEAIAETLAAMASSLTRLNAAPSALRSSEDGGAEWATNALREAAERARAQTRSVEGAVEEVLSLRTGGRGHGGA